MNGNDSDDSDEESDDDSDLLMERACEKIQNAGKRVEYEDGDPYVNCVISFSVVQRK